MKIKHILKFISWLILNGNDEITDLWTVAFGVYHILEILLDVFSASDMFPLWLKCLKAADVLSVIIFLTVLLRMVKNLLIAINTDADTIDEYLDVLEES